MGSRPGMLGSWLITHYWKLSIRQVNSEKRIGYVHCEGRWYGNEHMNSRDVPTIHRDVWVTSYKSPQVSLSLSSNQKNLLRGRRISYVEWWDLKINHERKSALAGNGPWFWWMHYLWTAPQRWAQPLAFLVSRVKKCVTPFVISGVFRVNDVSKWYWDNADARDCPWCNPP